MFDPLFLEVATLVIMLLLAIGVSNGGVCFHSLVKGYRMGDKITCEKCSMTVYYFPLLWLYKLLGRVKSYAKN